MDEKESDSLPSDLLTHIYTFLMQNSLQKAAKVLQKSCDIALAVQDSSEPGLWEFYTYYQKKHAGKRTAIAMETEAMETAEAPPSKKRKKNKICINGVDEHVAVNNDSVTVATSESMQPKRKKKKKASKTMEETSDSHADVKVPAEVRVQPDAAGDTDRDHALSVEGGSSGCPVAVSKGKSAKMKTPFKRVADNTEVDPRLMDNSFEAKKSSVGSWGEKANRDLKFTKGKSFRHEKTKKKRGTYKGGAIDTSVCSIKFDSD